MGLYIYAFFVNIIAYFLVAIPLFIVFNFSFAIQGIWIPFIIASILSCAFNIYIIC